MSEIDRREYGTLDTVEWIEEAIRKRKAEGKRSWEIKELFNQDGIWRRNLFFPRTLMAVLRSPLKQKMYDKKFILEDYAEKKFYRPIAKALQDDLDNFPIYISKDILLRDESNRSIVQDIARMREINNLIKKNTEERNAMAKRLYEEKDAIGQSIVNEVWENNNDIKFGRWRDNTMNLPYLIFKVVNRYLSVHIPNRSGANLPEWREENFVMRTWPNPLSVSSETYNSWVKQFRRDPSATLWESKMMIIQRILREK